MVFILAGAFSNVESSNHVYELDTFVPPPPGGLAVATGNAAKIGRAHV